MKKIGDHPNYGKDIMTIQREMSVSLGAKFRMMKAALQISNSIRKEIGIRRYFSLLKNMVLLTISCK